MIVDCRHTVLDENCSYDIIGDVHGCIDELTELLHILGYPVVRNSPVQYRVGAHATANRKLIFVGDLVDKGPDTPQVLDLVMHAVANGIAYSVMGNHDERLLRWSKGRDVKITHGLQETIGQLAGSTVPPASLAAFLATLPNYIVADNGRLVVAHAGILEYMIGKDSKRVASFTLYGQTTGSLDAEGYPVRINWSSNYHGAALVVYGHTPVLSPHIENNTANIDTGCVYGGALTAYRYPEGEVLQVRAKHTYSISAKYEALVKGSDTSGKL